MVIDRVFGLKGTGTSINDWFTSWADLRASFNAKTVKPQPILSLEQACQKICDILSNNGGQFGNVPGQASVFPSGRIVRARSFRFINKKRLVFKKKRILQGGIGKGFWVRGNWQPQRQRVWKRAYQPITGGVQRRQMARRSKFFFKQRGQRQRHTTGGFKRWDFKPSVTKEQLDAELEEYMSGSKAWLDKELDEYMSCTKSALDKELDVYMSKMDIN